VQQLEKVEKEVFGMGCLQKIGDGETQKGKRKRTIFRFVHRGLWKVFTVDDLSVVYVKERASDEEKRIQTLKRNVYIPSNGMAKT